LLLLVEVDDEVKIPEKGRRKLKEQKKKENKSQSNKRIVAGRNCDKEKNGRRERPACQVKTQPKLQKKQIIQNKKVKM
jgi:hypothetical protein